MVIWTEEHMDVVYEDPYFKADAGNWALALTVFLSLALFRLYYYGDLPLTQAAGASAFMFAWVTDFELDLGGPRLKMVEREVKRMRVW